MTQHLNTPYSNDEGRIYNSQEIVSAECVNGSVAAEIVRRVNAYDALVALAEQVNLFFGGDFLPALQSYYNADDDTEYIAPMRDALTEVLAALPPAPAALPVQSESGQDSSSGSMAAGTKP